MTMMTSDRFNQKLYKYKTFYSPICQCVTCELLYQVQVQVQARV